MRLRALLALVPVLIVAAACSSNSASTPASGASSSGSASSAASSSSVAPATFGPAIPNETTIGSPVARSLLPTVSGTFGQKPSITVPTNSPPDTLQRVVLSTGSGPAIATDEYVTVNYLGQVWGGGVFDNSYDRKTPFTFQVGVGNVVPGWDYGLLGATQGSRVLLTFPPQDGYGAAGKSAASASASSGATAASTSAAASIPGNSWLIFVVDIVKVYSLDSGGQADAAKLSLPSGIPTVGGELGQEPTLSIPSSLAAPTATRLVVIAQGTGPAVTDGDVAVQYVAESWDGTEKESSWPPKPGSSAAASASSVAANDPQDAQTYGPTALAVAAGQPFANLEGVPLGSRVLELVPTDSSSEQPAIAFVLDLVLQVDLANPAAETSASATG